MTRWLTVVAMVGLFAAGAGRPTRVGFWRLSSR